MAVTSSLAALLLFAIMCQHIEAARSATDLEEGIAVLGQIRLNASAMQEVRGRVEEEDYMEDYMGHQSNSYDCTKDRMTRVVKNLDGQYYPWSVRGGSADAHFPSDISSIGHQCYGELVHQSGVLEVKKVACSEYNKWQTLTEIADTAHLSKVVVYDEAPQGISETEWRERGFTQLGVHISDIGQGQLGNCYLLASLGAVAYHHPRFIENMFVDLDQTKEMTFFKTKWHIGGEMHAVVVDHYVSSSNGKPNFVRVGKSGEFWPIILEKAWAKLVGSYMDTVAGLLSEGLAAITGAPILTFPNNQRRDEVWKKLLWATSRKFPIGAGSGKGAQILQGGHAYSMLEAYSDSSGKRILKMFDPWNRNHYQGEMPNPDATRTGMFSMTLDEYIQVFPVTQVALLREGHVRSAVALVNEYQVTGFRFTPKSDETHVLQIQYPGKRFLECDRKKVQFTIGLSSNLNSHNLVTDEPYVFSPVANQEYAVFAAFGCSPKCNTGKDWVHLALFGPQKIALKEDERLMRAFLKSTQKNTWKV